MNVERIKRLEEYYTNDYDNDHEFGTKTDCLHSYTFILLHHYIDHIIIIHNLTFILLIFPFISIHSEFIVDIHYNPANKIIFSIHFVITA